MNPQATERGQKESKPLMGRLFGFFGKKKQSPAVSPPPAVPHTEKEPESKREDKQEKKEKAAPKNAPFFSQLADGQSVIDGTPRSFTLSGHTHTVVFTYRRIMLDGKPYCFRSGDMSLDITKAARVGNTFVMEAGAFGRTASLQADEAELNAVFRTLLSTGSHAVTGTEGETAVIARI